MSGNEETSEPPDSDDRPFWTRDSWDDEYNRPRGLFSDADRFYLREPDAYADPRSGQAVTNRKADIRERLRNALQDGEYLRRIDPSEVEKAVGEIEDDIELSYRILQWLIFLYELDGKDPARFEGRLESAIHLAEEISPEDRAGPDDWLIEDVDVDIDIHSRPHVDEVEKRYREGEFGTNLTPKEIGMLVQAGRLDPDDLEELGPSDQ